MKPRSWLYVPGDDETRMAKVLSRGADAVVLDLEDGVAHANKEKARRTVSRWLADRNDTSVELWVRVNPAGGWEQDLRAVCSPVLTGICLAKAEEPGELQDLARFLDTAAPNCAIQPLIESGLGLANAVAIARSPRVRQLQLGEADLAADLGLDPGPDEEELLCHRGTVVMASAAAQLLPAVGAVTTELHDRDLVRVSTDRLRRLGFGSRACIHPMQVEVSNSVFTPSEDTLDAARDLLAAYEASVAAGSAVFVGDDGRMVDEAVVRRARHLLGGDPL